MDSIIPLNDAWLSVILSKDDLDIDLEELKRRFLNKCLKKLLQDGEITTKIKGMCYRNWVELGSGIQDDVLQETLYNLAKINFNNFFLIWCESPQRILGLAITIATRQGFSKMNNGESPNQSLAKKILFASNFKKRDWVDGEGDVMFNNQKSTPLIETPNPEEDIDVWRIIKENLNEDELDFLQYILENVYSKKRIIYGRKLRNKLSYNEYKINFIMLKNKIKDIIKKNKIKGYGNL